MLNIRTLLIIVYMCTMFTATAIAGETAEHSEVVRSAAEIGYTPFSLADANGAADGFSVELLRASLAAMGRGVDFRVGPWAQVRELLKGGEIDALPLVGRTPEREKIYDFTFPYMSLHGAIVVRKGKNEVGALADLKGRQVAVMKGDNAEEFLLRQDYDIDIHTTSTFEEALEELSQGRHDAVVMQRLVALRLLNEANLANLQIINAPIEGFRQDFCFAVREGDGRTLALLNEGLALVMADGTYRRLHAKWFAALQLSGDRPIIIGGDHNYPPFEYLDKDERPAGFAVEITQAIAREMNLPVQIRLGPWQDIMDGLNNGEIDAVQGMFYSTERDRIFEFSPSYLTSNYVAVVRKDSGLPPQSFEDLAGKSIIVQQGDVIQDVLAARSATTPTAVETQEDVLKAVSDGSFYCALVPRLSTMYLIDKNGWTNLAVGRHSFFSAGYSYAVPDGQAALLSQLSEGLTYLEKSGEYRRIYEKWMSLYQKPPSDLHAILRHIAMGALPLLALLSVFILWWWSLRRQVANKTRELQESTDQFKYVFEAANVGKALIRPNCGINANQAFADLLGYTRDELKEQNWHALTFEEDIDSIEKIIRPLRTGTENGVRLEKRYVHKSGALHWADISIAVCRDNRAEILYFIINMVDITERKVAEEALRKSEGYQSAMIGCSPVALFSIDLHGRILTWNRSAERIFNWTSQEIIGKQPPFIPGDVFAEFRRLCRKIEAGHSFTGLEVKQARKDGTLFDGSLSLAPVRDADDHIMGIMCAIEDISERKQSRLRIEHLNHVLRTIRDVNQLIVRERDHNALILEGCRLLVTNRGYLSAIIILVDACDRPEAWALEGIGGNSEEIKTLLEQGKLLPCCESALSKQDLLLVNDRRLICGSCPIAPDCASSQSLCIALTHDGKTYGYLAAAAESNLVVDQEEQKLFAEMAKDLAYALSVLEKESIHKQGEIALQESEARFRLFAELAPVGVMISDLHGQNLFISSKFTELFGYTLDDIPSVEEWWRLAYPDQSLRDRFRRELQTILAEARESHKESNPLESPIACKNGKIRQVVFRMATAGTLNFIVLIDISERKRAEEEREKLQSQLIQAQKMESVGRLAGGVAHDYNNMLNVIIGFTELALGKITSDDPMYDDLQEVFDAARRATDITRQLLAFARKQTIAPRVLELNDTVESMLKMLRRLIGEDIDLSWQPGANVWSVNIDPSQLDQLLVNLCVNARDAIADVGRITIETQNIRFDKNYCADHRGFTPGEFVLLAISDDGSGMDKATLDNLFEPFFTTKNQGKGTGLGLSTVYGIVKQNGGFVNVYSEPENGSTFRIYLPRHEQKTDWIESSTEVEIPRGREETIMIVEDETSILKLGGTMLKSLSYSVLEASAPGRALEVAEDHRGNIHLLITDVVMPDMNGRDLAAKMQALYPNLKVLFMSGYTADVIAHRGVLDKGVKFMQKPFSKHDLAMKVREALTTD